jgi:hypothetical protein
MTAIGNALPKIPCDLNRQCAFDDLQSIPARTTRAAYFRMNDQPHMSASFNPSVSVDVRHHTQIEPHQK